MDDYARFLGEVGLTEADCVRHRDSVIFSLTPIDGLRLCVSSIEGAGVCADKRFAAESFIGPFRRDGVWSMAGRYANHDPDPNARPVRVGDRIELVATREIQPFDEITVNYRDVRDALGVAIPKEVSYG